MAKPDIWRWGRRIVLVSSCLIRNSSSCSKEPGGSLRGPNCVCACMRVHVCYVKNTLKVHWSASTCMEHCNSNLHRLTDNRMYIDCKQSKNSQNCKKRPKPVQEKHSSLHRVAQWACTMHIDHQQVNIVHVDAMLGPVQNTHLAFLLMLLCLCKAQLPHRRTLFPRNVSEPGGKNKGCTLIGVQCLPL